MDWLPNSRESFINLPCKTKAAVYLKDLTKTSDGVARLTGKEPLAVGWREKSPSHQRNF